MGKEIYVCTNNKCHDSTVSAHAYAQAYTQVNTISRVDVPTETATETLKFPELRSTDITYTEAATKQADFKCEPNTAFSVDCNRCACGSDGKISWCSRRFCA